MLQYWGQRSKCRVRQHTKSTPWTVTCMLCHSQAHTNSHGPLRYSKEVHEGWENLLSTYTDTHTHLSPPHHPHTYPPTPTHTYPTPHTHTYPPHTPTPTHTTPPTHPHRHTYPCMHIRMQWCMQHPHALMSNRQAFTYERGRKCQPRSTPHCSAVCYHKHIVPNMPIATDS